MKTDCVEFAPLEVDRAIELEETINTAGRGATVLFIDPDEQGIGGSTEADIVSPAENTNALVRYQRHYRPGMHA